MHSRSHPGSQLPAHGCGTHQNRTGLIAVDEILERRCIGFDRKPGQFRLIVHDHLVSPVMQQLMRLPVNVVPQKQGIHGLVDHFGHFPGLADELICHRVNVAVHMVDIHGDSLPRRFVHRWLLYRIFPEFHGPLRSLADTQTAHFAGGADGKISLAVQFHGAEGTQIHKHLRIFDMFRMQNQFWHRSYSCLSFTRSK